MSVAYLSLLVLVLAPMMANAMPVAPTEIASSREPRQLMMPSYVPWVPQPGYAYRQYGYGQNPFFSASGHQLAGPIDERFGFALLASLFGGGGGDGDGDGDGDDDRYSTWNFRPLANLQQPFAWPMAALLG
ncbi:uncharacterized protein LOC116927432 [Daphnia magna]|uniref:Secreted protein n=1 Tax=Daphnia magna TaxID=35525 RepID=A0A164TYR8_9CRUS|nr:uncharacterized protein LOC116927432 [Daphnia magna]KZS10891.1 Uncharacterized protein APZ42_024535 [Daphnia magna]